ncbi:hypothetical protein [Kitasatospora indigofera]|uniref:hypothetical protein n=1 Tax=Kitasatospora indigofera TaxID=67307 RepID=UPI0036B24801
MDVKPDESDDSLVPASTNSVDGDGAKENTALLLAFSGSVDRTVRRLARALESDIGDIPVWVVLSALEFTADRLLAQARRAVADALTPAAPTGGMLAAETGDPSGSGLTVPQRPPAASLRLVPRPAD